MIQFHPSQKILRMLPVGLIRVKREYFIFLRPGGNRLLFALPERLHPGQFFVSLLVQILAVAFIFPTQCKLLPAYRIMISVGTNTQSSG